MHDHQRTAPQIPSPGPRPAVRLVQHRELYPFASHWLDAAGHRLHYLDEGPGLDPNVDQAADRQEQSSTRAVSTLVLLHGNPTWSFLYRGLIRQLRVHYRCIAPDLSGFGLSPTPPQPLRPAAHAEIIWRCWMHSGSMPTCWSPTTGAAPSGSPRRGADRRRCAALYWPTASLGRCAAPALGVCVCSPCSPAACRRCSPAAAATPS